MRILSCLTRYLSRCVPKGIHPHVPYGVISVLTALFVYGFWIAPPSNFPLNATIRIEEGMNVERIAERLVERSVIRSERLFVFLARVSGTADGLVEGQYRFDRGYSIFTVLYRLHRGLYGFNMVKVVIPEGATNTEIASILDAKLENFEKAKFLEAVKDKEGYLFPDTYLVTPVATYEDVIRKIDQNFKRQIGLYEVVALAKGHTLHEILTMASLIEEEARKIEDRRMVAGILWNRIDAGMLLQVDAVFPYIVGRNTYEVTKTDLNHNSLYNTYRYKGLPPGPISNPGKNAIDAALNPTKSNYLYYLSDRKGNMHYAETFDEHKKNRVQYLNS